MPSIEGMDAQDSIAKALSGLSLKEMFIDNNSNYLTGREILRLRIATDPLPKSVLAAYERKRNMRGSNSGRRLDKNLKDTAIDD